MPPPAAEADLPRVPLNRRRVLTAAVALADDIGIEAFTIRKLAAALDVKPMAIYHHVPNKEAIIDGMVDIVFDEINEPATNTDWKTAIRDRSHSARAALTRHPWATPLMESRATPGQATLRHHEAVLACFRRGGFSVTMTAHAYALVDSYLYGFAQQETNLPATGGAEMSDLAKDIIEPLAADQYPYLMELTMEHVLQPDYDFGAEFEFGLELILDGLEIAANADVPRA